MLTSGACVEVVVCVRARACAFDSETSEWGRTENHSLSTLQRRHQTLRRKQSLLTSTVAGAATVCSGVAGMMLTSGACVEVVRVCVRVCLCW